MDVIAKYLRLSSEDDDLRDTGKMESNSISNQRDLIDAYIAKNPAFSQCEVKEYCDDGWSGRNFDRPNLTMMLEQVKQGSIQCIIVKDISRFGRDYLTVGAYLSRVFPFMGVRFIAVNDGFDSDRQEDIDSFDTKFKTLIYDCYSRDISRKVRSAKTHRAQRGDFLSPCAPYGYKRDSENRKRLIIDPNAAVVVRRIFDLALAGYTNVQIANQLNSDAVLTPMLYKRAAGCSRKTWPAVGTKNFWTHSSVSVILHDERYTGKSIFGKKRRNEVGRAYSKKVDRSEWIIVPDTHERIVTEEEFLYLQGRMRSGRKNGVSDYINPLRRKVQCGICGHILDRIHAKIPYYCCRTPTVTKQYACSSEKLIEQDLWCVLQEELRNMASVAVDLKSVWDELKEGRENKINAALSEIDSLQDALRLQKQHMNELYEDFALGGITKEKYQTAKKAAVQVKSELEQKIVELKSSMEKTDAESASGHPFILHFTPYAVLKELSQEILEELLKVVVVYPENRLEIIWNYREDYEKLLRDLR